MQSSREDCGAACVCMIINNYFNKNLSLIEIRPLIKNTLNGTSFGSLKVGLEKIGIKSTIYKSVKDVNAFQEFSLPIITQIKNSDNSYHYIVVYKCTKSTIFYGDPNCSSIKKENYQEFLSKWTPYVIQINVSESNLSVGIHNQYNKITYLGILSKIKGKVFIIVVLSVTIYFLGIFSTSIFNAYFNIVIPNKLFSLIIYIMIIYVGASLVKFVLNYLLSIIVNALNKIVDSFLSNEFFEGLFHKSPAALEYFGIGEIIATLSNIILIRQRFFTCIVLLPLNCIWLFISLFLLIRINANLSGLVLFLIVLLVFIVIYANDKFQLLSRQVLLSNKKFNDKIIDIFSNVNMIKEYQQDTEFIDRGKKVLLENIVDRNKLLNYDAKFTGVKQVILEVFNILLFSVGVSFIIDGYLMMGSLLTYNAIIGFALNPLLNIANVQSLLTQGKAAQDLLFNFLNSKINLFGNENFPDVTDQLILELNDISFSYDSRNTLLKNINLFSKDNKSISVIGPNGSGKTTIGKMLARYYLPDEGTIKINGLDINKICEKEFNKKVIFIDSNEELISSTIIDNILLNRNISSEKINLVLSKLKILEFVKNFEKGYDTQVGKGGVNLSVGQKQLIKIARATIEEKSIYIFDEITSGLDDFKVNEVIKYLLELQGLKIFVTHETQLINSCDKVLKIE